MARRRLNTGGALTIPQVCEQLNVARHTIYALIERGELPAFMVGNRYRVEPDDLRRYKERHRAPLRTVGAERGTGGAATGMREDGRAAG